MNPYRKRQRRKVQRAQAHALFVAEFKAGPVFEPYPGAQLALYMKTYAACALRKPVVIAVSNPVGDNWVQQAFKEWPK